MNEITLGQTVLRAAFGGDCLKFDGRKSQEIRERKMSRISDTGTLRPMHGTQSGCFCSANVSSPAPVKAVCSVQSGCFCSANIQLCDGCPPIANVGTESALDDGIV